MSVIQDDDFIVGGGATTPADVIITAGGAVLAPDADQLTYVAGGAGTLRQATFASGSLVLQGSDAVLAYNRLYSPESGSLAVAGGILELQRFERSLNAGFGVYEGSGYPLSFKLFRSIRPTTGQLALNGSTGSFTSQKSFTLEGSSYTLTGNNVELQKSGKLVAQSGLFALVGSSLSSLADKSIRPLVGSLALAGQALQSTRVAELGGESGVYLLSASDVLFAQQQRFIELTSGVFTLTRPSLLFVIDKQPVLGRRRPTSRRFTPGGYSFSSTQTVNGREVRRLWGNFSNDASLELEYDNISESIAVEFLNLYDQCYGDYTSIAIPRDILAGADTDLRQDMILTGTGLKWYFAQPPTIRTVIPGICNLSIRLKGKSSDQRAL